MRISDSSVTDNPGCVSCRICVWWVGECVLYNDKAICGAENKVEKRER